MEIYHYHIEAGQFSFDFEAPLLGGIDDFITIFISDQMENGKYDIAEYDRIHILDIDFENRVVSCSGSIYE